MKDILLSGEDSSIFFFSWGGVGDLTDYNFPGTFSKLTCPDYATVHVTGYAAPGLGITYGSQVSHIYEK